MDVLIEGKITEDEPVAEVIETLMELKTYPHLVLRISQANADLEGRIAFSHGGYILGGRINNSDDSGYKAIHQLLSVKNGNYAILDPGRQQIADINQTLWIVGERVIERLPDLPETPIELFDASKAHDGDDSSVAASASTAASAAVTNLNYGRPEPKERPEARKTTITNVKGKARSFNKGFWFFLQWILVVIFCLVVGIGFAVLFTMVSQRGLPGRNGLPGTGQNGLPGRHALPSQSSGQDSSCLPRTNADHA